jgi:hypothetical protein
MPRLTSLFAAAALALALGACSKAPNIHGSPPLSALPDNMYDTFSAYVGPGTIGAVAIVGPHFMPGACDGLWTGGDRKVVCDLRARYLDDPKEAKPDPNQRFRCVRTLGGGTECNEVAP